VSGAQQKSASPQRVLTHRDSHRVKVYSINKSKPQTAQRLEMLKRAGIPIIPITHPLEVDLESQEHYDEEMRKRGGRDPKE